MAEGRVKRCFACRVKLLLDAEDEIRQIYHIVSNAPSQEES